MTLSQTEKDIKKAKETIAQNREAILTVYKRRLKNCHCARFDILYSKEGLSSNIKQIMNIGYSSYDDLTKWMPDWLDGESKKFLVYVMISYRSLMPKYAWA